MTVYMGAYGGFAMCKAIRESTTSIVPPTGAIEPRVCFDSVVRVDKVHKGDLLRFVGCRARVMAVVNEGEPMVYLRSMIGGHSFSVPLRFVSLEACKR